MLDYRWSNNPPIYRRTFAPNWYRTHTVPKFGLQSSYRSMPLQPAHFTDNIVGITLNSQHFTFFAKLAQPPCNLATLQPYFKKTLWIWRCVYNVTVTLPLQQDVLWGEFTIQRWGNVGTTLWIWCHSIDVMKTLWICCPDFNIATGLPIQHS